MRGKGVGVEVVEAAPPALGIVARAGDFHGGIAIAIDIVIVVVEAPILGGEGAGGGGSPRPKLFSWENCIKQPTSRFLLRCRHLAHLSSSFHLPF